jgi:hypothetical protein
MTTFQFSARTGFISVCLLTIPWQSLGEARADPLPNCTITFDPGDCPFGATSCGATFVGGDDCMTVMIQACYTTGSYSMLIVQGNTMTITFADDVDRLTFLFAHQGAAAAGTMDFFDAMDQPVGSTLMTTGDCSSVHAPDSAFSFDTPVRKIEIVNTGTGNIWLDTMEINPECAVDGDCDDSDPCTIDECRPNGCRNDPIDCDDNDPCTTDSCDSMGNCVHDPIVDCNANGNDNGNANGNGNANDNANGNDNTLDNMNDNTGDMPNGANCGEMSGGCAPGAMAMGVTLMIVGIRSMRRRRRSK